MYMIFNVLYITCVLDGYLVKYITVSYITRKLSSKIVFHCSQTASLLFSKQFDIQCKRILVYLIVFPKTTHFVVQFPKLEMVGIIFNIIILSFAFSLVTFQMSILKVTSPHFVWKVSYKYRLGIFCTDLVIKS